MHQPMTGERGEPDSSMGLQSIQKNIPRRAYFKTILTIVKILAGLALLILSVRGIQWANLISGIRSANLGWLVLTISAVVLGLFLKFWRWVTLVRNYQIRSNMARLYSAYFVGQALNIILPLRGGELVRIGYFAGEPTILPEITSTIVLEKYLDIMALTVCGLLVSYKISLDNILNLRGWLLPFTGTMTILLVAGIVFGPPVWRKNRTRKILPERIVNWVDKWVQASLWLRNPSQVLSGILMTILIWGVMWFTNLLLFKSLGLPLGGTAAGLVLILVYVGLIPALMPGNIGPFYYFASLAVLPFGIIRDQALIFAVLLHAIVTLPALLAGVAGLLVRSDRAVSS